MENFNTTDLDRFSWLQKPYMRKKTTANHIQTSKNIKSSIKQDLQIYYT